MKTDKKPIAQTFNTQLYQKPAVNFEIDRFDSAILKHGYNVYHHKALRCPCVNKGTNSPLPNCENCNGVGWFYVEKTLTKALMQNMDNKPDFSEGWGAKNLGSISITTMYNDDVTYMDKFEAIDLESSFSQTLNFFYDEHSETLFSFLIYEPKLVSNSYKFESTSQPLTYLIQYIDENSIDWDFKIDKNKFILNSEKYLTEFNQKGINISIRYKHTPIYCVVDIQREVFKAKDKTACNNPQCDYGNSQLPLRGQPQKSVGKRLHYIFDADNLSSPSVFDNTNYPS